LPPHLTPAQGAKLPNQADQLWGDPNDRETRDVALAEPSTTGSVADLDYLAVRRRAELSCTQRHAHTHTGVVDAAASSSIPLSAGLPCA
jgi:hypothetical protein